MKIGVPSEIKNHEYRVGLIPASVKELVLHGHTVFIEKDAGKGIGIDDAQYVAVGAILLDTPQEIFATADLIIKVKEPQPDECRLMRPGQVLFTYLHLAPDLTQTQLLLESDCIAIAYETVTDHRGHLPLLSPMSEIAGRMSIQAGAHCLEIMNGGKGMLLGGVPGVAPAKVVVLGGGVVGTNALRIAIGMEADVTVIDRSVDRLRELDFAFGASLNTIYSTQDAIEQYVSQADLVIGAVLVPGATAPRLVTRDLVTRMSSGSVLVDVAIDQGGCFETSRVTTHEEPTYMVDEVVHYCVGNMPGAAARTATFALNNVTLPFILALANQGYQAALQQDAGLMEGLNIYRGQVACEAVANAHNMTHHAAQKLLSD